ERVGEPPSSTQLALDTAAIQHAIDTAVAGHNRTVTQPQSLPLGRGLGRGLGRDGATAESAAVALPASQAEPLSADVDTTEAVAPLADGRRLETRPPAFAVLAMSVAL